MLAAALAACGGEDKRVVSVDDVARVTKEANVARIAGTSTRRGEPAETVTGEVDLAARNYHFTIDLGDGSIVELVVIGGKGYQRGTSEFTSPDWCSFDQAEAPAFEFGSVLESLSAEEGELERLGTEKVRGVVTTHYRMSSSNDLWNGAELWVDDDDRLRRLVQTTMKGTEDEQVDSGDLFDFGADVPPITAPPAATPCIASDEGSSRETLKGP